MYFSQWFTTRWHDTDSNRQVRPAVLQTYMQETASAHYASRVLPLDELRDREGLAFLLSSLSLCIYKPLYAYEQIEVRTWVTEGHGLRYNRCFRILRGKEIIAEAVSVWGLMNLLERRLLRADETNYPLEQDLAPEISLPRRLRMPTLEQMELVGERRISYSDIDYNLHMNNTHYPDLVCDFTPDITRRRVNGMMFSFLHEATYGHVLHIYRMAVEDGYLFRTVDEDGTVCLEAMVRLDPIVEEKEATHEG